MIHTVCLDDEYVDVKKLSNEIQSKKKEVEIVNSYEKLFASEGYMTKEDFWEEADKRIINVCKKYGVL